jgi:hypothetical protein
MLAHRDRTPAQPLRQRLIERQKTLVLVIPKAGPICRAAELTRIGDFIPVKEELQGTLHTLGESRFLASAPPHARRMADLTEAPSDAVATYPQMLG